MSMNLPGSGDGLVPPEPDLFHHLASLGQDELIFKFPDSQVHGANMGSIWDMLAPSTLQSVLLTNFLFKLNLSSEVHSPKE